MSDTQAAIEFRFLDEKRKTTGLTPAEDQRWQELATTLGVDLSADAAAAQQAPQGYYGPDGNWYPYAPQGYDPQVWGGQPGQWQGYYPPQPQGYYGPDGQWYQYPAQPQPQPYFDPATGQYYQAPPQQWAYPPQPQGYYDQQGQWVPTAPAPQPQWDPQTQQWVQPQWPVQPQADQQTYQEQAPVEPAAPAPPPAWAPPVAALAPAPPPPALARPPIAPFSSSNSTPEAMADDVMEIHDEEVVEIPLSSPPARKVDAAPAPLPVPDDPVADLRNALSFDDEPELPALSPIPPPRLELKPAPAEVKIPFVPRPFFPPSAPPAPIPSKSTPSFPLLEMPSFEAPAQPLTIPPANAPVVAAPRAATITDVAVPVLQVPAPSVASDPITAEVPALAVPELEAPRAATPLEVPTFEPGPTSETDEVPALVAAPSFDTDVDFSATDEAARAPTQEVSLASVTSVLPDLALPADVEFQPEAPVAEPSVAFEPEPVSFAPPQPEPVFPDVEPEPLVANVEPEPVSFAEPEPVSFAAPEPEPVSFAALEPEPVSFAAPEPEPVSFAAPEPEPVTFAEVEPVTFAEVEAVTFAEPEPLVAHVEPELVAEVAAPTAASSPSAFDVLALPPDAAPIPTFEPQAFPQPVPAKALPEALRQADVFPSWDSVPEPTAEPAFDAGGWSNDDDSGGDVVLASNWDAPAAPGALVASAAPPVADDPWGAPDAAPAAVDAIADEWADAPVLEATPEAPPLEATVIEAELSGSPDDQVSLAGTSDFVRWNQPAEATPAQAVEIDSDLGEFVVESGSAAALATGTVETASQGFDDQKLELASNVDFINHEALTSTGEAWQGDGRGVELDDALEGEVIQGDVIQGEVLQGEVVQGDDVDLDVSEPVADSWGVAVSEPSPVPQRPFVPPLSSPPPAPPLGAGRVGATGTMPALSDPALAPTGAHVALGGAAPLPGSGSVPALGASRVAPSGSQPALGDAGVRPAPTGSHPALGDPGVRTSPSGLMPRPPITQTKLPAFDASQIIEVPTPIPGEHRVILHTMEGGVKRGSIRDADLAGAQVVLHTGAESTESIPRGRVKAIFFMLAPGSRSPPTEGSKVRVTFRDGRQVAGFSKDFRKPGVGFFVVPADNRTNTERIFIYRHSVSGVAVD
jgi:hypothetical protein